MKMHQHKHILKLHFIFCGEWDPCSPVLWSSNDSLAITPPTLPPHTETPLLRLCRSSETSADKQDRSRISVDCVTQTVTLRYVTLTACI